MFGGADHRRPWMLTRGNVLVDLRNQDHRVADHHADQRDDAEDGNEAHGSSRDEQRAGNPDQRQRRRQQHQEQSLEAH